MPKFNEHVGYSGHGEVVRARALGRVIGCGGGVGGCGLKSGWFGLFVGGGEAASARTTKDGHWNWWRLGKERRRGGLIYSV